jgi:hypothetical protein
VGDSTQRLTIADVAARTVAGLSAEERATVAVYVDRQVHPAGNDVLIGGDPHRVPYPAAVVFIDDAPGVNWGHECHYLLIDLDTGGTRRIDARFPPSLTDVPGTFRLVWRPAGVDDWALWSDQ